MLAVSVADKEVLMYECSGGFSCDKKLLMIERIFVWGWQGV